MKKIIYINSVYFNEISGQGSFERNFLSFLEESKDLKDVMIFSVNKNKNEINQNIISLKLNKNVKLSYLTYQLNLLYYLFKELYGEKRQIVIYVRLAPYNIVPFFLLSFFNISIVCRSGPIYQNLTSYKKVKAKKLLFIFKKLLKFYYTRSKSIIVVTDKIKDILMRDFNLSSDKIKVISNPINNSLFETEVNVNEIRQKLNINPKVKVIGFVGDIYEGQGVQNIFSAITLIRDKFPIENIYIIIVGSGSYLDNCKSKVKELNLDKNVLFLGRVTPDKVVQYISIFDICMAPFTQDDYAIKGSSALKVLEYLYCNKFVITIDVKEYKFIEENHFGLLYEIDNIADLSNTLIRSLNMSHNIKSKDYVNRYYSKSKVYTKYLEIIKNCRDVKQF